MSGRINCKDKVLLMAGKKTYELDEIGIMAPDQKKVDELHGRGGLPGGVDQGGGRCSRGRHDHLGERTGG